jgi:hypothetical protein
LTIKDGACLYESKIFKLSKKEQNISSRAMGAIQKKQVAEII